jgi:choline monooxygenase
MDVPAPRHPLNLDARLYTDPAVLAAERDRIFRRAWQYVGPAAAVAEPGGTLAADLAGRGVIVIRGRDGVLRGFANVCRHRGARLLEPGRHRCGVIVCPYHKWGYADTGRLVQAPWFGRDPAIIPEDWPLVPAAVEVWRGLVFAAFDPAESLLEQLGDLPAALAHAPLEEYVPTGSEAVAFAANWKTYTDNYVEGYHIPGTHPSFHAAIDFEAFETTAHRGYVRMTAPPREGYFYQGLWLWAWPNLTISLVQGGMNVSRIDPVAVDRTVQHYDFYFAGSVGDEARAASVAGLLAVVREDVEICASTQGNYAGGGYTPGPLSSRHEAGVAYFQERVRAALAGWQFS